MLFIRSRLDQISNLAAENFEKLKTKVQELRAVETELVRAGVSPHAPYTVCGPQLELIAEFADGRTLPLMMHAAESEAEELFLREGCGAFAEGLARRAIEWKAPRVSTIQYLKQHGILDTRPLLAHCIRVDDDDIETLRSYESEGCALSEVECEVGPRPRAVCEVS